MSDPGGVKAATDLALSERLGSYANTLYWLACNGRMLIQSVRGICVCVTNACGRTRVSLKAGVSAHTGCRG